MSGLWIPPTASAPPQRELVREHRGDTWRVAVFVLRLQARVHGHLGDGRRFEVTAEFDQADGARMHDTWWAPDLDTAQRVAHQAAEALTKRAPMDLRAIARGRQP